MFNIPYDKTILLQAIILVIWIAIFATSVYKGLDSVYAINGSV